MDDSEIKKNTNAGSRKKLLAIAGLIAAPITIFIIEFIRIGDTEKALLITTEMVKGCGWAFVVRFGLASLEIGVWAFWAFGG